MAKTSFSGELVRNKKVVLTVPGEAIKDAVMGCGMATGRDTDNIAKLGNKIKMGIIVRLFLFRSLK